MLVELTRVELACNLTLAVLCILYVYVSEGVTTVDGGHQEIRLVRPVLFFSSSFIIHECQGTNTCIASAIELWIGQE